MLITKTKYMAGLQCLKLLWIQIHKPKLLEIEDDALQQILLAGQEVGLFARQLFPGGIAIDSSLNFWDRIKVTREALAQRRPIYEAAISSGNLYAQIDILVPVTGGWNIVEVKSKTKIADEYYLDVAFQNYVCGKAGLPIRQCKIATINGDYAKRGPIRADKLFTVTPVSRKVAEIMPDVPKSIAAMVKALAAGCPKTKVGGHCSTPYTCPLQGQCWAFLPRHNVFELYRCGSRAYAFMEQGILRIRDIPADTALSHYQRIQVKCVKTGKPYINTDAIAEFLNEIEYPIHFLDFETFSTPIPIFNGTNPYQQIPFQYSMHVLDAPKAKPTHYSFLAEGRDDPRPKLLQSLKHTIGRSGTVLTFNMSFEKAMLKQMAEAYPENKPWIRGVLNRINDLIIPFRKFAYYHPRQHGSNSLKRVMPALTKRNYDNLTIADGSTASQEFMRVTFGDVSATDQRKVRNQLLRYCGQDSGGMINIMRRLVILGKA